MTNVLSLDRIRQLNRQHWRHNVWSYFPTPPAVLRYLLNQANMQDHLRVLEPSAGKGAIAQKIYELWDCHIDCIEKCRDFNELLRLKGFNVIGEDFMQLTPASIYDRVIANPPFDRQMTHIPRMYQWLKPGGLLVSVANACFLEPDKARFKDPAHADRYTRAGIYHRFFQWLDTSNARITRLPKGSFSNASRTTQVETVLIAASKPQAN